MRMGQQRNLTNRLKQPLKILVLNIYVTCGENLKVFSRWVVICFHHGVASCMFEKLTWYPYLQENGHHMLLQFCIVVFQGWLRERRKRRKKFMWFPKVSEANNILTKRASRGRVGPGSFQIFASDLAAIEWWRSRLEYMRHYLSTRLHNFLYRDTAGVKVQHG